VYETDDGLLGLPADNLWRCMYDAATAFKLGTKIKRALIPLTDIEPLYLDGETRNVDDHLDAGHIDVRAVQVARARTMRSRPIIPAPWSVTHRFEMMTDEFDFDELQQVLNRAGRLVGIGDFRPRFGTFTATYEEM
jgi:hypothetical protein